jgi:hypothetical protein
MEDWMSQKLQSMELVKNSIFAFSKDETQILHVYHWQKSIRRNNSLKLHQTRTKKHIKLLS